MNAIILDVDGTLWDTTDLVARAWTDAALGLHIALSEPVTGQRLKKEFGKPMDEIAGNLFPDLSPAARKQVMDACCAAEEACLEACRENLLFPGVEETIRTLSASRKLFIVSNCQKGYIELFLKKTGLSNCILDFECFGNTGLSKGENIRLLMERQHLSQAFYVGDTQGDLDACRHAGIPFVFASYGFGHPETFAHKISCFSELCHIL